jgi:DNA adenine methylase
MPQVPNLASKDSPKPILKWAGGKARLLSQLALLMPEDVRPGFAGRLVEPFVGGAAMFLWLRPSGALLADSNDELINLYEVVRRHPDELETALDFYQSLAHDSDVYYAQRADDPQDPVKRAARLIYLNRNCFNGLYRLNRSGKFNVPFGRYRSKPKLYDRENLALVSDALGAAELRVAPFEETLAQVEPGDFVYLDPPYYPISQTSSFTGYTGAGFGHADQVRLRDAILETHRRTSGAARIMLSNSNAPGLIELYEPYPEILHVHSVTAMRAVGAKSSSRGLVEEVAITNYTT